MATLGALITVLTLLTPGVGTAEWFADAYLGGSSTVASNNRFQLNGTLSVILNSRTSQHPAAGDGDTGSRHLPGLASHSIFQLGTSISTTSDHLNSLSWNPSPSQQFPRWLWFGCRWTRVISFQREEFNRTLREDDLLLYGAARVRWADGSVPGGAWGFFNDPRL